MSASHDDAHAHGAPDPAEITHPLLWTACLLGASLALVWWFFHFLIAGRVEGRRGELIPHAGHGAMAMEPDHAKLGADRSDDVIQRGALVYAKNCANCHGTTGDNPPSVAGTPPRNFRKDAFKGPLGGGPYGLYVVVTRGFGSMPAFPSLSAADRYAVIHFVRETMVKTSNAKNYVAKDPDSVARQIPPPGAAAAAEPVARDLIEIKAPILPLLAGISEEEAVRSSQTGKWLEQARHEAGTREALGNAVQQLITLAHERMGLAEQLHAAVGADNRVRFTALLAGSDGSGAVHPFFSLLPEDQLVGLFQFLKTLGGK
jgi:mono/diheme cytochrome c family protein